MARPMRESLTKCEAELRAARNRRLPYWVGVYERKLAYLRSVAANGRAVRP